MRRNDLKVIDLNKIVEIFDNSPTLRLGLHDSPYPYVVPLSYGYDVSGDRIELYIHGALEGKKHDLISKNNFVCVEVDYFDGYGLTELSATANYSSIIAYGRIFLIVDEKERLDAISSICRHCGLDDLEVNSDLFKKVGMYKIVLDEVSAKSNMF